MPDPRSSLHAQDRLLLLLALVPYLMDHESVSVTEAAAQFGVDEEQIREAVRLIAVSGVPGETAAYLPGDLFDIAWDDFEQNDRIVLTNLVAIDDAPRFSAREAAALIAGLQYLSALPENADRAVISSLMAKLARGASASPSQVAVAAGAGGDAGRDAGTTEALRVIRDAVGAGIRVEFDYLNARGEREHRLVDPLRIESADQDWYLRGWCHLREAVRTFRLDRMSALRATTDAISHPPADVPLPETLFQPSRHDLSVRIEIAATALPLVADYLPRGAKVTREGAFARTSIRVAHYHGLKRLANRLSGVLTVLGPDEARREVAQWAAAGWDRYEAASPHDVTEAPPTA